MSSAEEVLRIFEQQNNRNDLEVAYKNGVAIGLVDPNMVYGEWCDVCWTRTFYRKNEDGTLSQLNESHNACPVCGQCIPFYHPGVTKFEREEGGYWYWWQRRAREGKKYCSNACRQKAYRERRKGATL
jgi:ferredoxin